MKFVNNWLRAVFFSHSLLGVVIMMFLLAYCMKTLPNFEKIAFLYSACSFLYIFLFYFNANNNNNNHFKLDPCIWMQF